MIFELDYRSSLPAVTGVAHFSTNAARLFTILSDPTSWGKARVPRVASSSPHSKIVLTFDDAERVTVNLNPWSSEFCQVELILEGFADSNSQMLMEGYWSEVISMVKHRVGQSSRVVASAPGKVNVYFAVGAFQKDGFHEVASCYQALSLRELVATELSGKFEIGFAGPLASVSEKQVPKDASNLVYKAGLSLQELGSNMGPELVSFTIHKSIPIAGGMAGGSADAAAALVALNELFQAGLESSLSEAASSLGSDVPFSLAGGTAIGTGRGEKLTPVAATAFLHWVISPSDAGLSTPDVYRKLDILRTEAGVDVSRIERPEVPKELVEALVTGDAMRIAELMHNDLEIAALALRPELAETLEAGRKAGSLKSMISGSGPTVLHLAKDRIHAEQIASRLEAKGYKSIATYSSQSGTRLES